ncbi:PhzA/PhzB family protein, partial [Pseudomonas aeruginosa]|uniref:PhzA/PhzB family protein n=1 Tax=Pseudomonas aeruginosa TaxID=287 RepID=UPI003BF5B146
MLDNAIPQGFEDAVELRRKNRETVVKYMNTKGQDRLRRHELFVEDGCVLLDYELSMLREDEQRRVYLGSTHWPWIGERTRQVDG